MYTDSTGHFWNLIIGAVIGGATSWVTQGMVNLAKGDNFGDAFFNHVDFADVIVSAGIGALTCGYGNGGKAVLDATKVGTKVLMVFGAPAIQATIDFSPSKGIRTTFDGSKSWKDTKNDYWRNAASNALTIGVFTMPSNIKGLDTPAEIYKFSIEKTLEITANFAIPLYNPNPPDDPKTPPNQGGGNNNGNKNINNSNGTNGKTQFNIKNDNTNMYYNEKQKDASQNSFDDIVQLLRLNR